MPDWMWVVIAVVGSLGAIAVMYLAIFRGVKGSVPGGWSLDVPGPQTTVLRERNGTRVYVEYGRAAATAERMATVRAERDGLMDSYLERGMSFAETHVYELMYEIDDAYACCSDQDNPLEKLWADAIGPVTGNLGRKLLEDRFKGSFKTNGFYAHRTISPDGAVGDKREWADYLTERTRLCSKYIAHFLKNKVRLAPATAQVAAAIEDPESELYKQLAATVERIYCEFWRLHHEMKVQRHALDDEWLRLQQSMKETQL